MFVNLFYLCEISGPYIYVPSTYLSQCMKAQKSSNSYAKIKTNTIVSPTIFLRFTILCKGRMHLVVCSEHKISPKVLSFVRLNVRIQPENCSWSTVAG